MSEGKECLGPSPGPEALCRGLDGGHQRGPLHEQRHDEAKIENLRVLDSSFSRSSVSDTFSNQMNRSEIIHLGSVLVSRY
jgi:hypothetical protein